MRLTTTRNLITEHNCCLQSQYLLERFDIVYPNIDSNQEISLLDMIHNNYFMFEDVLWVLYYKAINEYECGLHIINKLDELAIERWGMAAWLDGREEQKKELIELLS